MSKKRIFAIVDQKIVDEIRELVGQRGMSEFIGEALRYSLQRVRMRQYMDELGIAFGPLTAQDEAEGRRLVDEAFAKANAKLHENRARGRAKSGT